MNKVIIYGLLDPRTGNCFYIGKTINSLKARLNQHIRDKSSNYLKECYISDIIQSGNKPVIIELVVVDNYFIDALECDLWEYYEMFYIKHFRDELKQPLTNVSKGGEDGKPDRSKRMIEVKQYSLTGEYIQSFNSINDAAKYIIKDDINLNRFDSVRKRISKCTSQKVLTVNKYFWIKTGDETIINSLITKYNQPRIINHTDTYNQIKIELNQIRQRELEIKKQLVNEKKQKRFELNNTPEALEERKRIKLENIHKWKQTELGKQKRKEQRDRYKQTEQYRIKKKEYKKTYFQKKKNLTT